MIRSRRRRLFALLAILGLYGLCVNMYFHESPSAFESSTSTGPKYSKEKLMNEIQMELNKVNQEVEDAYQQQYNGTDIDTTDEEQAVPFNVFKKIKMAESKKRRDSNKVKNGKAADDKPQGGALEPINELENAKESLKIFEPNMPPDISLGAEVKEMDSNKRVRLFNEHPENKADKNHFDYQKYVGIVRRHAKDLKEKCKKLEKKSYTLQDKMMVRMLADARPFRRKKGESLMDPTTGLLVCHTPKAGSSTWVNIFTHIYSVGSQTSRRGEMQQELWEKQEHQIAAALSSTSNNVYFRIILVRHPFERLASAFKNKIVYNEPWILSKMILSIKEFVGNANMSTSSITFKDVVRYIVKWPKHKVDRHFLPMTIYCNPCLNNYDGVIKMDKFNEETKAVLLERGYKDIADQIPTLNNNAMVSSDNRLHEQYFSGLSLEELNDLYELYKWDFELFGYKNDLDRFYSIVESSQQRQEA